MLSKGTVLFDNFFERLMINMQKRTAAIVLAAGRGTRMGTDTPKQYMDIGGYPLIYYSLKAFSDSFVDEIVLVCSEGDVEYVTSDIVDRYGFFKVRSVVRGGSERYHSVYNGLTALRCGAEGERREPCDIVFIHDGARPFVNGDIIKRTYDGAVKYGAVTAAVPAKDTIRLADTDGFTVETLRRDLLWQIQTPQVFDFYSIYEAYSRLTESMDEVKSRGISVTDDAMVLELFSEKRVKTVMGDYRNIKVTTPEDVDMVKHLLFTTDRAV